MYNTELSDDVYTVHCSVRNNLLHFRDNDVVLEVVKTLSTSQNEELTVDFSTEHIFHNYRGKAVLQGCQEVRHESHYSNLTTRTSASPIASFMS